MTWTVYSTVRIKYIGTRIISPCMNNTLRKERLCHPNHWQHSQECAEVSGALPGTIVTVTAVLSIFKSGGGRGDAVTKHSIDGCGGGRDVCMACLHFTGMMDGVEHKVEQESRVWHGEG
jgi:hypothetical protein